MNKTNIANITVGLVSLGCMGAAAWMAIHDKQGWGWFLFVGMLCAGAITTSQRKNHEQD
jgi:hypothetical protein